MTDRFVSVICYTNGQILFTPQGVTYDKPPVGMMRIRSGIPFDDFEGKIRNKLRIFIGSRISMNYRCPLLLGVGRISYTSLPITTEQDLRDIFAMVQEMPPPNIMELYVDVVEGIQSQPIDVDFVEGIRSQPVAPLSGRRSEDIGPSTMSPTEGVNVRLRLEPDDACPSMARLGENDINIDDNHKEINEESDSDGEEETACPVDLSNSLMRVIEHDGSLNATPLQEDNNGLSMEEDESHDVCGTAEPATPASDAPSPSFMELNSEALTPMSDDHDNISLGWNESHDFFKGLTFPTKEDLQNTVKRCYIAQQREYVVVDSDPNVWSVRCKNWNAGCQWRLRAAKHKRTKMFEITKCEGTHTCVFPRMSRDHRQLDLSLIFGEVFTIIRRDPSISVAALQEMIKHKYKYDVHYKKVWRAKKKVMAKIFGDWDESYSVLPQWIAALIATNPGTIATVLHYPEHLRIPGTAVFYRCFWAFGASIEGFKHCRPIIQIDGTHLYGKYRGKMLIATGIDAESHIFPLAFAIVEEENTDNWAWFLKVLRYEVTRRTGLCIISDRHEGILSAIGNAEVGWTEPNAHHRYCLRHVASNFNDKVHNVELRDLAKKAGSQHQVCKFEALMRVLEHKQEGCTRWLDAIDKKRWTMAYDGGVRYGWMTSNVAESFNGVLKGARMYPITALVQLTFYRTIAWFHCRRDEIAKATRAGHVYTTYAVTKMRKWASKAGGHTVTMIDRQLETFEVVTGVQSARLNKGGNKQVVNLRDRNCSCGKWQCYGIPCSQVQAVCRYASLDCDGFIEEWYRLNKYIKCYEPAFHPIPHPSYWPPSPVNCKVIPNFDFVRKSGRLRTSHITNKMDIREPSSKIRCGQCGREGHNRRRCPNRHRSAT